MTQFTERFKPQGYREREEPSFSPGPTLQRPSQNVFVSQKGYVARRKGFSPIGTIDTTPTAGIKSAFHWVTNTNKALDVRSFLDTLQVFYNGDWLTIATGFGQNVKFAFDMWWNRTEVKDEMIFVNGTDEIFSWTGGLSEVFSVTTNTITKKYSAAATVPNPFTFNAAGNTLTQVSGDFTTLGFAVGDSVNVNSTLNSGRYTIKIVTPLVITFSSTDVIVNEVSTTALIGVTGRETWAAERFTTTGVKNIIINGTTYTYTGGENTNTLTGVTPDPLVGGVVLDDIVIQEVQSTTASGGDYTAGYPLDILTVVSNQVYTGWSGGRSLFISRQDDYADFSYSTPVRLPGEGGFASLDENLVGVAPSKQQVYVSAGRSSIYLLAYTSFSDGSTQGELITCKKLDTAYGQGAVSPTTFVPIKNGILYLSHEPSIDFLGNVELVQGTQTKPLSDPIEALIKRVDTTDAQGVFFQNNVFYILPYANIVLWYDIEQAFWQPPQVLSGSLITVMTIDGTDVLAMHSKNSNNTYQLFSTLKDNGTPITGNATWNIEMSGNRALRQVFDEIYLETRVNGSAKRVLLTAANGYQGADGFVTQQFGYDMGPLFTEVPATEIGGGFGTSPFGTTPFGSLFPNPDEDPEIGALRKIRFRKNTNISSTFETQITVSGDELGSYWEVWSYGINLREAPDNYQDIMV